MLAAMQAM
jgi:hypothetical protein